MIELKHPGKEIYASLLIMVLEKVEKFCFGQRNGPLNCFVRLLKLNYVSKLH